MNSQAGAAIVGAASIIYSPSHGPGTTSSPPPASPTGGLMYLPGQIGNTVTSLVHSTNQAYSQVTATSSYFVHTCCSYNVHTLCNGHEA